MKTIDQNIFTITQHVLYIMFLMFKSKVNAKIFFSGISSTRKFTGGSFQDHSGDTLLNFHLDPVV